MNSSRARILCIADVPNWIFQRHIDYLSRYLGDEFEIATAYRGQAFNENDFDLIYALEFMLIDHNRIVDPNKYVTGIRSFISWADWDFYTFLEVVRTRFRRVHVVSRELYNIFAPLIPGLAYVTHGVDLDVFTPRRPETGQPGKLRIGWAGNRFTPVKGFTEYIAPLAELPGVQLVYHGYADHNLALEQMPQFYETIDAYICASSYEGNNNALLEAAAMERAIVTTPVGTVPEYLEDQQSALIVERRRESFIAAVTHLRDHPEKRAELGRRARQNLLEKGWGWENKAEEYRAFFRSVLQNDLLPTPTQPMDAAAADPALLAKILHAQHLVLREIHIGDRILLWEEANTRERLEHDLDEIRASETYQALLRLSGSRTVQNLTQLYKRLAGRKG